MPPPPPLLPFPPFIVNPLMKAFWIVKLPVPEITLGVPLGLVLMDAIPTAKARILAEPATSSSTAPLASMVIFEKTMGVAVGPNGLCESAATILLSGNTALGGRTMG